MAGAASAYADDDQDAPITDINVTPLVDIVLVILIVFMITVPSIVATSLMEERDMSIVLPRAGGAQPMIARPERIVVNVNVTGQYTVGGAPKSKDELNELLRQAAADNPGRTDVSIRADKACPVQVVVDVLSRCAELDIRDCTVTVSE
jgi:biopolymer transport protein ExbD